jgi:RNA polymerase-interacting CarD/CdnL/TRCF family regulator
MNYKVGDTVVHWSYGLGEITNVEEKVIHGQLKQCYVVRASRMTIWIPIDDSQQHTLRTPVSPDEFTGLFDILSGPAQSLPQDRGLRRDFLISQLQDGQLESICKVVRDLTNLKRKSKLNDQEKTILERASNSLLTEWIFSLKVPLNQAQLAMTRLLEG